MKDKRPAVYIMASGPSGTLYTGVTSDLPKRAYEHKNDVTEGFAGKYGCKTLVYYKIFDDMLNAIIREKQIKAGSRKKKLALINAQNPEWQDLYETLF